MNDQILGMTFISIAMCIAAFIYAMKYLQSGRTLHAGLAAAFISGGLYLALTIEAATLNGGAS